MNNVSKYNEFINLKDDPWRKAKQIEISRTEEILESLVGGFDSLTTRNSMTLRILGFIINRGVDNLELSPAGSTFINSLYKQKILDEQLMKVYLNGGINPRLKINIIPLKVFLLLLGKLESITFEEYEMFVCWVHEYKEIVDVIAFIQDARNGKKDEYQRVFENKVAEIGVDDFSDNIRRLFDMLLLSSYFQNTNDIITTSLNARDINIIVNTFDDKNFTNENYFEYLTTNDGWEMYGDNIEVVKTIRDLKRVPVEDTAPEEIFINIIAEPLKGCKSKITRNSKKINFLDKIEKDMLAGDKAEKIVIKYEKNRLTPELLSKVEQVSLIDDALGYDVLSFTEAGEEKHIEVKGISGKPPKTKFSFYISDNEISVAQKDPKYYLYIVFDYASKTPKILVLRDIFKDNNASFQLIPKKYLVEVFIQG
jgi:hypothetical protein